MADARAGEQRDGAHSPAAAARAAGWRPPPQGTRGLGRQRVPGVFQGTDSSERRSTPPAVPLLGTQSEEEGKPVPWREVPVLLAGEWEAPVPAGVSRRGAPTTSSPKGEGPAEGAARSGQRIGSTVLRHKEGPPLDTCAWTLGS